jgi:hypothetical protein
MNAYDRCDQCSAAAQVRVRKLPVMSLADEMILDFCSHHFNKNSDALDAGDWRVVSRRREHEPA